GLILAAEYQFRRVIGVEYSAELASDGETNVANAKARLRCKDISVVVSDAGAYAVPVDVTIIFFNNSFHGQIFKAFLENLETSWGAAPRKITLIISVPEASNHIQKQLEDFRFLHQRKSLRLPGRSCVVYVTD